ncbi:MAG TPA: ATP-binding protein [Anaerolineales bacterium]|nr:ATP-binding protein [Anaerolineales bacterium]
MLRSLRNRLIFTHILPVLTIVTLTGIALFYALETRFLLPRLAENLSNDSRLLAEVSRGESGVWANPLLFQVMMSRVRVDPAIRVMFLSATGQLLYSSDPADSGSLGQFLEINGLELARAGQEAVLTNYSIFRLGNALIDVLTPVLAGDQQVIGIVRLSYRSAAVYDLFAELRILIAGVLILGLFLGGILGSLLAINIGKPLQRVTGAIQSLARSEQSELLTEQGPDEIRDLTRAVNVLVERLNSLEQARSRLLANLVHELGRPLGALRSAIQALAKGAAQDPHLLSDLAGGMDGEAARMQHILDDLAHLHDQVVGTLELDREAISLSEWLKQVLLPWQQAAQEKQLAWEEQIPGNLPTILADPVRLGQVIGNLASNAVRYTPAGKSVLVTAGVQGQEVWIKVSDTGAGIPVEEQGVIFTPFYRGDQGRRIKQGMGLGLSIARDLAVAHGGRIQVESAPGQGSQFTLWIPIG